MGLAVIVESGLAPRLVHCDYNNHLGDNNPSMAAEMAASANGAAQRWGIPSSVLFDCQQNLTGAVNSIRDAINASSSVNRFYLVCAGPMEVAWRGINASDPAKRQYCTAISHSLWNDEHADTPQMTHTWSSIQSSGVQTIHIQDQNPGLQTGLANWTWLRDSGFRRGPGSTAGTTPPTRTWGSSTAPTPGWSTTSLRVPPTWPPIRRRSDTSSRPARGGFEEGAGGPVVTSLTLVQGAAFDYHSSVFKQECGVLGLVAEHGLVPRMTPRREVFVHEAGHLVIGLRLGIREQGIVFAGVRASEAANGGVKPPFFQGNLSQFILT